MKVLSEKEIRKALVDKKIDRAKVRPVPPAPPDSAAKIVAAIGELTATVKKLDTQSTSHEVQAGLKQVTTALLHLASEVKASDKRSWKFSVQRNSEDQITAVKAVKE